MTMLITLAQAKEHLRIDADDGDADLELKIHAASGAVMNYLKSSSPYQVDENGEPVMVDEAPVPKFEVYAATCLMLGYLNRDRDEDGDHAYEQGYLPKPVTALLYPLRDPALA